MIKKYGPLMGFIFLLGFAAVVRAEPLNVADLAHEDSASLKSAVLFWPTKKEDAATNNIVRIYLEGRYHAALPLGGYTIINTCNDDVAADISLIDGLGNLLDKASQSLIFNGKNRQYYEIHVEGDKVVMLSVPDKNFDASVNGVMRYIPTMVSRAGVTKCDVMSSNDSDGDGVIDQVDDCPQTLKGIRVDTRGCPIDSDDDGVPDYYDECPNTPKGFVVNDVGCPVKGGKKVIPVKATSKEEVNAVGASILVPVPVPVIVPVPSVTDTKGPVKTIVKPVPFGKKSLKLVFEANQGNLVDASSGVLAALGESLTGQTQLKVKLTIPRNKKESVEQIALWQQRSDTVLAYFKDKGLLATNITVTEQFTKASFKCPKANVSAVIDAEVGIVITKQQSILGQYWIQLWAGRQSPSESVLTELKKKAGNNSQTLRVVKSSKDQFSRVLLGDFASYSVAKVVLKSVDIEGAFIRFTDATPVKNNSSEQGSAEPCVTPMMNYIDIQIK